MRKRIILKVLLLFCCINITIADSMKDLLPDKAGIWFWSGEDQWYSNQSLYDYIDGGAELFLSYGFDKLISRTYIAEDQPDITVDVFDMITAQNAFGVFCHIRDGLNFEYGQGSQVYDEAILFWKDHYYVSVSANDITPASIETVRMIAKQIETSIDTKGALPEILNLMPEKGVDTSSLIYFKHYIWQNSLYYFADDNFLEIDQDCDALLSRISYRDEVLICLLIEYPLKELAGKAVKSFIEVFEMKDEAPALSKIEDGSWLGCGYNDHVFMAVFKAKSEKNARDFINDILKLDK